MEELSFIEELGTLIDESFFLIGLVILSIEIVGGIFRKTLKWRGVADMFANISTQAPFLLFEVFVMSFAYALFYQVSYNHISWTFETNWLTIGLAILVADFIYYWEHRLSHEVRCLWINHAVHHSSRHFNITTGVRFGPFEGVWGMIALVPMLLIGFPAELVVFGSLAVLAYQTWIHTELIGKLGPLEWLLNTPSHHRVHHGSDEAYLDKNYGGILIVWDRLFGTFVEEQQTPRYGLKRDFDSVNPFKVWFSEYPRFLSDLAKARTLHDFLMHCFARPEWVPIPSQQDSQNPKSEKPRSSLNSKSVSPTEIVRGGG